MDAERASNKTTRAFRTIGEAAEELELQPHVLRFWESKFSQIQPMKRGGGRRFYRPEDIEFIRGIKTLLHDEKHPIKDVQRLIKKNGAQSVVDLGRSVERASRERKVREVNLVPQRILQTPDAREANVVPIKPSTKPAPSDAPAPSPANIPPLRLGGEVRSSLMSSVTFEPQVDRAALEDALEKIDALRAKWADFGSS